MADAGTPIIDDGSTPQDWTTIFGPGLVSTNAQGNPIPSYQTATEGPPYRAIGRRAVGHPPRYVADVWVPTGGLGQMFFGCDDQGNGYVARLDTRALDASSGIGIAIEWGAPDTVGTGFVPTANAWHQMAVDVTVAGRVTMTVDGVVVYDDALPFATPTQPMAAPAALDVWIALGSALTAAYFDNIVVGTQLAPPTLISANPPTGRTGELVTLTGTALTGATSVTFGGVNAAFTPNSDTTITATAPPRPVGAADVVVTTGGGTSDPVVFTYLAAPPPEPPKPPPPPGCDVPAVLRLELLDGVGAVVDSLDLMDAAGSFLVDGLDLGFPTVREVVAALPTRDGDYDTSRLLGPRVVTVTGTLVPSGAGSRQAAMQRLAYWCQPRIRPRLVYAVDADQPARAIGLRGSQMAAPMSHPAISAFTVSWVAPDPVARGLDARQLWLDPAGDVAGRAYDLTFDRTYPAVVGGSGLGIATNAGDYQAWPVLRIYGDCTDPAVYWVTPSGGAVVFAGLHVAVGDYVEVDTFAQTVRVNGLAAASRYETLDFAATRWAGLEPGDTQLRFAPAAFAPPCALAVLWHDTTL